jgi:hypothetical protein
MDPVRDPPLLRKSGIAGNRTRNLWVCGQELCPLDHSGGLAINVAHFKGDFVSKALYIVMTVSSRRKHAIYRPGNIK